MGRPGVVSALKSGWNRTSRGDGEAFSVESIRPGANPRLPTPHLGCGSRDDLTAASAKVSLTLSFGGALLHLENPPPPKGSNR